MSPLLTQTIIIFLIHFSICLVKFAGQPDLTHCLIGVSKDLKLNPRSVGAGFIYPYKVLQRLSPLGRSEVRLELVHKTTLDEIPYAMCSFQGRVLVGVGKLLRLYDLGKKKLLRKCENKVSSSFIFYDILLTCL